MATFNGTPNDDLINGTSSADTINGNGGNDTLNGEAGNDRIDGGSGNNILDGGDGNDTLESVGVDQIDGGAGTDALEIRLSNEIVDTTVTFTSATAGSASNGTTFQNVENFDVYTGVGNDSVDATATGNIYVTTAGGNDNVQTGTGQDALLGGDGNDTLRGGAGNDSGFRTYANRFTEGGLYGGAGDDELYGEAGNDLLEGGSGNDTLVGVDPDEANPGIGEIDDLEGNAGADLFVLGDGAWRGYDDGNTSDSGRGDYADILDFSAGEDTIQLQGTPSEYLLAEVGGDTEIYINKAVGELDELIGIVQNVTGLSLNSDDFNFAPVGADDAVSTDEDTILVSNVLADNGSGADSDADGDILEIVAINNNAAAVGSATLLVSGAILTMNSNGTFDYDPNGQFESLAVGEIAVDSFTYTVSDGQGGTNTATVDITINGVNDAPVASNNAATTDEDSGVVTGNVLLNDNDVDASDTLTVLSFDTTGTLGNVVDNGDGTFTYNPNGQFEFLSVGETATDSFSYTVSDGQGGTDTATVSIAINGVNDTPLANDDADVTDEDSSVVTVNVLANDSDIDASDALTVLSFDTTGTLGNVVDNGDGTFTYNPNGQFDNLSVGETATDSFTYLVSDGQGGTDTATVDIAISGVNDVPLANDDADATDEDSSVVTVNVLTNDSDVDASDTLTVLSFDTTGTLGNVVDNGDGTFTYNPNGQFDNLSVGETATDSFTYLISDGQGGTDTATVDIAISGVNDVPLANDDADTTDEDASLITVNVLANDSDVDASDTLTVLSFDTTGTLGNVVDNGDGTFTYNPNGQFDSLSIGQTATDSFAYTVSDGRGGVDTATVSITINGVDNPTSGDDTLTGTVGDDVINGGGGNDSIFGLAGNDLLIGSSGNDLVDGGDGDDTIEGGSGEDVLLGGLGRDSINGGGDADRIEGGDDADILNGSGGGDRILGEGGADIINGNAGNDRLFGGDDGDNIRGSDDRDFIFGESGNDKLFGGVGRDELEGGTGNDILRGQGGDDRLIGVDSSGLNPGANELDRLIGGAGADDFVLGTATNVFYVGSGNTDYAQIKDFDVTQDRIILGGTEGDYSLQTFGGGTRVFADDGSTQDLIGLVQNVSLTDFSNFSFV